MWSLSGDQGNQWMSASVPVNSNSPFSVVFEGVRGSGSQGDIALDDVVYTATPCVLSPPNANRATVSTVTIPPVTPKPSPISTFNCNFDANLCGWTQLKGKNKRV